MPPKRQAISVETKLMIIDQLNAGSSQAQLCREYGLSKSTISTFRKSEAKLREFVHKVDAEEGMSRKKLRKSDDEALDDALLLWFQQARSNGTPLSGPILQEKANILAAKINPETEFKASDGWLWRFQKRHGIRELKIIGESRSCDDVAASNFMPVLREILREYEPEQIYNADETGLFWKCAPNRTLAQRMETDGSKGYKVPKERVTFLLCANASGLHKLTPLCIGKSKNPRCFHHINQNSLPVKYTNSKKAWMTSDLFNKWFFGEFVPKVRCHLRSMNVAGKAVLLLDNCPAHPPAQDLITSDDAIKVVYLPRNTTAKLQPMDGGIIANFKMIYRRKLLQEILITRESDYLEFLKTFTMKDMIYLAAESWDAVQFGTIVNTWRHTLGRALPCDGNDDNYEVHADAEVGEDEAHIPHIVADAQSLHMLDDEAELQTSEAIIDEWLHIDDQCDVTDSLTDEDIVNQALGMTATDDVDEDPETEEVTTSPPPLACDAVAGLHTAIAWLETQDVDAVKILQLRQILSLARDSTLRRMRQTKIGDFFRCN